MITILRKNDVWSTDGRYSHRLDECHDILAQRLRKLLRIPQTKCPAHLYGVRIGHVPFGGGKRCDFVCGLKDDMRTNPVDGSCLACYNSVSLKILLGGVFSQKVPHAYSINSSQNAPCLSSALEGQPFCMLPNPWYLFWSFFEYSHSNTHAHTCGTHFLPFSASPLSHILNTILVEFHYIRYQL